MRTPTRTLFAASLAAVAMTACVGPTTTTLPAGTGPAAPDADPGVGVTDTEVVDPAAEASLIARADGVVEVRDAPAGSLERTLPATTPFGSVTTLLVLERGLGPDAGWLEVALPVRPNGSTGFVREVDVILERTRLEVQVDTDARELRVYDGGEVVLTAPTAVGEPANPTPTGRFWLTDKVATDDPDGPYGAFALGLSARSETLTEFAGGDGQIAIHGTDQPDSIGQAVSHGCLRVTDEVIAALLEGLPLGTPVTIS